MERWIYNRGTHVFSLPLVWVWATGQMCWMHSHRETTWSTGEKQNKTKQRQRRANSEKKKQPKWEPDIVSLGSPAVKIPHEQNALILRFLSIPLLAFPLCLHVHIPEGEGIATVHLLPLGNNSSTALNLTCYPSKFSHPHSSPSHIPPLLWPVLSVYNSVQQCTVYSGNHENSKELPSSLPNFNPKSDILYRIEIFCEEESPQISYLFFPLLVSILHSSFCLFLEQAALSGHTGWFLRGMVYNSHHSPSTP